MAKHSFSYPAIPASAPTSPAVIRKSDRNQPATPQRTNQRASARHAQSPYTPITTISTPYTPISLRSAPSSNGSTLVTPASTHARRLSLSSLSPDTSFQGKNNKRSLADIAENWRTRANENGIRVASGESQFADDEDDEHGELDSLSFFSSDKALLPAPFLSTQRRARALSQAQSHAIAPLTQIPNPAQLSTPGRVPLGQTFPLSPGFMNTPPPKPSLLNKYRLRGTVTDPAHTRRRPAFGQVSELCDIEEDEFVPYPPAFSPATPGRIQSQTLPLHLNDSFGFNNLSNISDEVSYYDAVSHFDHAPLPLPEPTLACSVCGTSNGALALLNPCAHPLCSACLTSALNIVGEKDMECAVCNVKVDDFKLQNYKGPSSGVSHPVVPPMENFNDAYMDSFSFAPGVLESSFAEFVDRAQGASTPVAGNRAEKKSAKPDERVVLRIDNVPWDITPPVIVAWLKHPVERVHVLLDRKGKTLSHAFVEMANQDAAKAALRTSQNSVLGRGKRARGVTVTRSNQEELMRALFPSWQGNFDGARPSLAGLSNEHVISTLQQGLISDMELKSLLHLIRSPDSHFLKVPSLPFHSLMSILSKFPTDDDSRVFWSSSLRDTLYDVTFNAVQVLLTRVEENPLSEWTGLLAQLLRAAMDCHAFTAEQMSKLSDILEAALLLSTSSASSSPASARTATHTPDSARSGAEPFQSSRKANVQVVRNPSPYGHLAKEFGVEPHLVEALAHRLSKLP
ncbi:hypothetical protein EIP91_009887 [Steccherinum ochraceum]|uniref:RING-type domain-containing protein n=1 Tax=Steccherinum ochraceum TaxID=92696 RepID=A0A4R0RJX2_9APHY|nr:hypothetical protein EIP91_009887 [Steccherinum ochraceum]